MTIERDLVRAVLEAAFFVVVALVLAFLSPIWIAMVAGTLLLAIGFERHAAGRHERGERVVRPRSLGPEPALAATPTHVHVLAAVLAPPPRGRRARRGRAGKPGAPEQASAAARVVARAAACANEGRG